MTHVVAACAGTSKVRWAERQPAVRSVSLGWLTDCGVLWRHVDESEYSLADQTEHEGFHGQGTVAPPVVG